MNYTFFTCICSFLNSSGRDSSNSPSLKLLQQKNRHYLFAKKNIDYIYGKRDHGFVPTHSYLFIWLLFDTAHENTSHIQHQKAFMVGGNQTVETHSHLKPERTWTPAWAWPHWRKTPRSLHRDNVLTVLINWATEASPRPCISGQLPLWQRCGPGWLNHHLCCLGFTEGRLSSTNVAFKLVGHMWRKLNTLHVSEWVTIKSLERMYMWCFSLLQGWFKLLFHLISIKCCFTVTNY